jgi:hypothetical protein
MFVEMLLLVKPLALYSLILPLKLLISKNALGVVVPIPIFPLELIKKALLLTANAVDEPLILTDPVIFIVSILNDPNLVLPVTKSTLDVIVCTTNVCAVNVPATVKLFANDAVCAETAFDADCAKATNDAVEANEEETAFST